MLFIVRHSPEEAEEFLNDCTMKFSFKILLFNNSVKGFAKINESSIADKV